MYPENNDKENLTPEIDTEEDGYDGSTATDTDKDIIEEGNDTYWENTDFTNKVSVTYNGTEAVITSDNPLIKYYRTGSDVAIELEDIAEAEGIIKSVKDAFKDWQKTAKRFGAQKRDINLFGQRFITE